MPIHVITGDHDMELGSLDNFYAAGHAQLPKAVDVGDIRCRFLDICGPGSGGPNFRLGQTQSDWLTKELRRAPSMSELRDLHAQYPQDLKGGGKTHAIRTARAKDESDLTQAETVEQAARISAATTPTKSSRTCCGSGRSPSKSPPQTSVSSCLLPDDRQPVAV